MMQVTNIAIIILSVLDGALLLFIPLLDKQLYKNCPRVEVKAGRFFCNPGYQMPISRFVYSAVGVWVLCLLFITALVIVKRYEHGW